MNDIKLGRLFYVIGPSGVGKDSLMLYARKHIDKRSKIIFSHRYITRKPETEGENHIYLDEQEFMCRGENGFFSLQWDSHGYRYGIGKEINFWMANGFDVVVNGSREYLFTALENHPEMIVVLVSCSSGILRQRLIDRGRETNDEIELRLERARLFCRIQHPNVITIKNDTTIEASGQEFIRILQNTKSIESIN